MPPHFGVMFNTDSIRTKVIRLLKNTIELGNKLLPISISGESAILVDKTVIYIPYKQINGRTFGE